MEIGFQNFDVSQEATQNLTSDPWWASKFLYQHLEHETLETNES
jgi:hypothetical protein